MEFIPCRIDDVSDFDAFDALFQQKLTQIALENPEAEILLNISSGSPQMKFTICLLATNVKFRNTTVVQVKTPEKKSNTSDTTAKKSYEPDVEIKLNEDNNPNAENRCSIPPFFAIKRTLALKQVQALLKNYEYKSAKILLDSFDLADVGSAAMILTKHLLLRQDLKTKESEKLVSGKDFGIELLPIANIKCREETEFFLVLQNLSRTGKITEFTLRLNPFIIRMQELYLLKKLQFDCEKIKERDFHGIAFVKRDKIQTINSKLLKTIDSSFKYGFKDSPPSIALYNRILAFLNGDQDTAYYIDFFNTCEHINNERNTSAHSLYGMDESDLKKNGITSQKILSKLRKLLLSCYGKECKNEIFDIYDRINVMIMNSL